MPVNAFFGGPVPPSARFLYSTYSIDGVTFPGETGSVEYRISTDWETYGETTTTGGLVNTPLPSSAYGGIYGTWAGGLKNTDTNDWSFPGTYVFANNPNLPDIPTIFGGGTANAEVQFVQDLQKMHLVSFVPGDSYHVTVISAQGYLVARGEPDDRGFWHGERIGTITSTFSDEMTDEIMRGILLRDAIAGTPTPPTAAGGVIIKEFDDSFVTRNEYPQAANGISTHAFQDIHSIRREFDFAIGWGDSAGYLQVAEIYVTGAHSLHTVPLVNSSSSFSANIHAGLASIDTPLIACENIEVPCPNDPPYIVQPNGNDHRVIWIEDLQCPDG